MTAERILTITDAKSFVKRNPSIAEFIPGILNGATSATIARDGRITVHSGHGESDRLSDSSMFYVVSKFQESARSNA